MICSVPPAPSCSCGSGFFGQLRQDQGFLLLPGRLLGANLFPEGVHRRAGLLEVAHAGSCRQLTKRRRWRLDVLGEADDEGEARGDAVGFLGKGADESTELLDAGQVISVDTALVQLVEEVEDADGLVAEGVAVVSDRGDNEIVEVFDAEEVVDVWQEIGEVPRSGLPASLPLACGRTLLAVQSVLPGNSLTCIGS